MHAMVLPSTRHAMLPWRDAASLRFDTLHTLIDARAISLLPLSLPPCCCRFATLPILPAAIRSLMLPLRHYSDAKSVTLISW